MNDYSNIRNCKTLVVRNRRIWGWLALRYGLRLIIHVEIIRVSNFIHMAVLAGQIAEYIGRKWSLMIATIANIIGWLAISFAKDSSFLYMGRLLEGFGVGIISYTVLVYIAEIAPQNLRGGLGSVNQLSVTIGILLSYLLGLFINWRVLAVLGILPCLILIPGVFFIPESPRWLAKMGMTDDFEASLQVLRGFDTDITLEVHDMKRSVASTSRRTAIRFVDLKLKRYWLPLMIGIGLLMFQQLAGTNGVIFYYTTIFESAGLPRVEQESHRAMLQQLDLILLLYCSSFGD